ncbi:MAG: transporter substrate-binding domain-containing protein [Clostridia bacterium]|nr:transporter substrate-binding domain-containing protein [Clostridia bacterium]
MASFLIVAAFLALCVFGACSSDEDGEKGVTSSAEDVTGIDVSYENTETSVVNDGVFFDVGERVTLRASVSTKSGKAFSGYVDWTSEDEDVVGVSVGNILEAKAVGETRVTVTVRGNEEISCAFDVTVSEPGTVFKVGVKDDVKGFGYRDHVTGVYSGLEIELAGMIYEELNESDDFDYESVAYIGVLPDDREEYLQSGIVDCVIATYTRTEMRENDVDFSEAYYTDYVGVLMSGDFAGSAFAEGGDDAVYSLESISSYVETSGAEGKDITPCRVGYVVDSTAFDAFQLYLDSYNDGSGIKYADPSMGNFFEYAEYEDYDACEAAMKKGDIDLFVADHSILMSHMVSGSVMLTDELETADYAVGTKKADSSSGLEKTPLTEAIYELIDTWLNDGDEGSLSTIEKLISEWIDEETGTLTERV